MKRVELRDCIAGSVSGVYEVEEARALAYAVSDALFGVSRKDILTEPGAEVGGFDISVLENVCARLARNEPLQYVTGTAEFCGLKLKVAPGVLIPRPETEELVMWIAEENQGNINLRVLDIGTGSGAIVVALAKQLRAPHISAIDISPAALHIAEENMIRNNVSVDLGRVDILASAHEVAPQLSWPDYDIIVSNPPYVPASEYAVMRDNVRKYEPAEALFVSDNDPLLFYRAIAEKGRTLLSPGGLLYFEIHENFADDVCVLLKSLGYKDIECRRDINDKPRMIRCRKE